ncbi:MAG: hypothetical protein U1E36_04410 [Rickettsiales bacterium]
METIPQRFHAARHIGEKIKVLGDYMWLKHGELQRITGLSYSVYSDVVSKGFERNKEYVLNSILKIADEVEKFEAREGFHWFRGEVKQSFLNEARREFYNARWAYSKSAKELIHTAMEYARDTRIDLVIKSRIPETTLQQLEAVVNDDAVAQGNSDVILKLANYFKETSPEWFDSEKYRFFVGSFFGGHSKIPDVFRIEKFPEKPATVIDTNTVEPNHIQNHIRDEITYRYNFLQNHMPYGHASLMVDLRASKVPGLRDWTYAETKNIFEAGTEITLTLLKALDKVFTRRVAEVKFVPVGRRPTGSLEEKYGDLVRDDTSLKTPSRRK